MKLVEISESDGRIIAWYDTDVSYSIPSNAIEVDESAYEFAMSIYATHYLDGVFQNKDDIYIYRNNLSNSELFNMTLDDLHTHSSAVKSDLSELLKRKRLVHEVYLRDTDWIKSYELEHKLGITLIPDESSKWVTIKLRQECIDMINNIDSL